MHANGTSDSTKRVTSIAATRRGISVLDPLDAGAAGLAEDALGRLRVEPRIRRLDADEEPVRGRAAERGVAEERVRQLRQPVERQHPEEGGQGGEEDGDLEDDGDVRRDAVEGLPPDDELVVDR